MFPYLVPGDLIAFLYLGFRLLGIFDGYKGADDIRKSAVAAFYALLFCANAMKTPTAVYYFSDRVVACCGTVEALAALTGATLLSLWVDVLLYEGGQLTSRGIRNHFCSSRSSFESRTVFATTLVVGGTSQLLSVALAANLTSGALAATSVYGKLLLHLFFEGSRSLFSFVGLLPELTFRLATSALFDPKVFLENQVRPGLATTTLSTRRCGAE